MLRRLTIPLLVALLTGLPVWWAWPGELPFWRALGIVLGWAGCGLLLASLLLMLREPRLARWLGGLEPMVRWHHATGTVAYVLLLAHPLALALQARPESPRVAWQTLSPFSQGWPMWTGWIALILLMAGLAATFAARLPYRLWRPLHALLGVGVLAGLAHVFLLLGSSAGVVAALVLAVLLLGWRLVRADWGSGARPYLVRAVERVGEAMVEISLAPLGQPVRAVPGQFALVAFFQGPHYRGCGEFHPFTVSAANSGLELRIGVKALGDCTRHIQSLEPGVAARVQGPFGSFLADRPPVPQVWIAGGIGITPFLAVLRAGALSQPTLLLYLHRNAADGAFLAELQALAAKDPQLALRAIATGDDLPDLAALLPQASGLAGLECYLCGPPGLVAAATALLRQRGVRPAHIHYESFDFR